MTRQEMIAAIEAEMARRRGAAADRLNENPEKAEHEGEARAAPPDPAAAPVEQPPESPGVRPDAPPIGYGMSPSAFQGKFAGADPFRLKKEASQVGGPPGTRFPGSRIPTNNNLPPADRATLAKSLGGLVGEGLGGPIGGGLGMAAGGMLGRSIQGQPQAAIPTAIDAAIGAAPGLAMKGAGAVGGVMAKSANPGRAAFGNKLEAFVRALSPADTAMERNPMQDVSGEGGLAQIGAAGPRGANVGTRVAAEGATADASVANTSSMSGNIPPYVAGEYSRGAQQLGTMAPPVRYGGQAQPHGYAPLPGGVHVRVPIPGIEPVANGFVNNKGSTARWLAAVAEAARRGKQLQLIPELQQFAQESMTSLGPSSRLLSAPVAGLLGTEAP